MRLLAASDLHLGRIPSLPEPDPAVTGRSAWAAVIRCALDYKVDVLLLAGDVVQENNAWLEAFGALISGLEQLRAAGIKVVAVAGNHDAEVFPRVGQHTDAMVILGQRGCWESLDLGPVRLMGWSFPGPHHSGNPLASFQPEPLPPDCALIGLLHCDLDGPPGSPYAPVPSAALAASAASLWVLGHNHRGGPQAGGKAFYCGSPLALHVGEEGLHGAWLLEVDDHGRCADPVRIPLSPWEFRTLAVGLDQARTKEDVLERVSAAMLAALRDQPQVATLYCSLRLEGDCALSGSLEQLLRPELERAEALALDGVRVKATLRITDASDPLLDLPALAGEQSLSGTLARLILQAPAGPLDELPGLLERVQRLCPPDLAQPRELVALAARRLLLAVQQQKRGA